MTTIDPKFLQQAAMLIEKGYMPHQKYSVMDLAEKLQEANLKHKLEKWREDLGKSKEEKSDNERVTVLNSKI